MALEPVTTSDILIRFFITFVMSFIFGLERQKSHKPIGFGTFIFVAMGSCALGLISIIVSNDPLALLGAVVTGIGFLGAGALIKTTDKVFGFTTAASIWVFAIIGLLIGIGQFFIATLAYASVWLVVFVDIYFEMKRIGTYQKKVILAVNKFVDNDSLAALLGTKKYTIVELDINRLTKRITMTLLVRGGKDEINRIPKKLSTAEWVDSFKIE